MPALSTFPLKYSCNNKESYEVSKEWKLRISMNALKLRIKTRNQDKCAVITSWMNLLEKTLWQIRAKLIRDFGVTRIRYLS
jgi:hypothetical protein